MDFTVIICTYNRSNNLPDCFKALEDQQNVEELDWEVLLVDNNSSDDTKEVVMNYANKSMIKIRYVHEKQQGLNYARNLGMREVRGEYFSYVDDDILVNKVWLRSIYDAFINNNADAVGGRIHLDKSIKLPKWILPDMYGFLGYQDLGEVPFQMDGKKNYPFGGNMAFSRKITKKVGLFNPKLGRKGEGKARKELFKGAETDYFHRLSDIENHRIFYAPDAIVYHQIQDFQLEKKYFRTIHFNAGFQKAFFDDTSYNRLIAGVPLFLYGQFFRNAGKYLVQVIQKGSDQAFRQQMTTGNFLGMILGYHKKYKDQKH
jgi:glycosyltransferase involved in cell wall biosynthesis